MFHLLFDISLISNSTRPFTFYNDTSMYAVITVNELINARGIYYILGVLVGELNRYEVFISL